MANVWTTSGAGDIAHEVDPISRIEGHLGVKVTVSAGGTITDANAHGNLWRGFENFLLGREINDAITFVQRICGVCPVPHGLTSTYCTDTVMGYSEGHITFAVTASSGGYGVPKKAVLIRNMVLGCEFLMSSITHFYHLAAPSYIQGPAMPPWTPYFDNNYYHSVLLNPGGTTALPKPPLDPGMTTWDAVILSYVKALKIRRMTFEAGALFAGRMPMTSCYVGGGVTNDGTENLAARITAFTGIIKTVAGFVISEYIPIALALGVLYQGFDSQTMTIGGGLNTTASTTKSGNRGYGGGLGRFLAWGGFPSVAGDSLLLPGGVFDKAGVPGGYAVTGTTTGTEDITHFRVMNKAEVKAKFITTGGALDLSVPTNLTEDITNSRYDISALDVAAGVYTSGAAYPGAVSRTMPKRSNGYTFMKAPRWHGNACEVGPLARLAVAGIYPVDGSTIASRIPLYVPVFTNGTTLDPLVIGKDIWTGLTNDGILGTVNDWVLSLKGGVSTMDRLRARALESLYICIGLLGNPSKNVITGAISWDNTGWIGQLAALPNTAGSTWRARSLTPLQSTVALQLATHQGWGGTEAPRGALMHQATIAGNKIQKYQCIVPTTWNGSPKDHAGNNGAIESAMIGAPFFLQAGVGPLKGGAVFNKAGGGTKTTEGGTEVLRIAQSFDPCIACAVH